MYQIPEANRRMLETMQKLRKQNPQSYSPTVRQPGQKSSTPGPKSSTPGTKSREQTSPLRTKQQEFPGIDWDDTLNPDIQLCQLLYNERVRTFQKMQQMLQQVGETGDDTALDPDFGKQFARLDDSNRLAQQELESYNKEKTFLLVHPIAKSSRK